VEIPWDPAVWDAVREWASPPVVVAAGFTFPDGTVERAPAFTGTVRSAAVTRPGDVIRLECADPSAVYSDRPITAGDPPPTGTALAAMAALTAAAGLPLVVEPGVIDAPLGSWAQRIGDDRAELLDRLADTVGACLCARPDGVVRLHVPPPVTGSPAAVLTVGPHGWITESSSEYDRAAFANRYTVTARWSDASGERTASGTATDTDPASPTRWGGPAGRRERVESADAARSDAACAALARGRLARVIGAGRGVRVTGPIAPWIDYHAPVIVRLPWGDALPHLVESVTHSMPDALTVIDTRRPLSQSIE